MDKENKETSTLAVKQSKTRFHYAVGTTLLTFAYMYFVKPEYHAPAWNFLMIVAGGFGVSKATEHLKIK